HKVFEWSNTMIGFDDPEYGAGSNAAGKVAAAELYMYANQLAGERRLRPCDDLVSVLLDAEVEGEKLSELDFNSFFLLLLVAGNETTRNTISGGMLALFEHPEEWARLRHDPALLEIRIMFEELLRRLPDIELAGPVTRLRSNFIGGIKHMPVRFTPR